MLREGAPQLHAVAFISCRGNQQGLRPPTSLEGQYCRMQRDDSNRIYRQFLCLLTNIFLQFSAWTVLHITMQVVRAVPAREYNILTAYSRYSQVDAERLAHYIWHDNMAQRSLKRNCEHEEEELSRSLVTISDASFRRVSSVVLYFEDAISRLSRRPRYSDKLQSHDSQFRYDFYHRRKIIGITHHQ